MAAIAQEQGALTLAPPRREGRSASALHPYLLAFVASAASLVLELVAGRMLSPYVGVSLYTWTSIIGVVLAGVSIGNFVGGRYADRGASPRRLGALFLVGGALSLATIPLVAVLGGSAPVRALPLLGRIFVLTTLIFLPPNLVLGMVPPVAIRCALPEVGRTGRVVGLVYACATLGSLVGNFATGFVLTAYLPVNTIVVGVGLALIAIGGLAGEWWRPSELVGPRGVPSDLARSSGVVLPLAAAAATVFVASFASMGVELAASRLLAPYLGLSLYSWTGIIGVVLLGITLGNYLGGWIADRWPGRGVLGASLFVSGLGGLLILRLAELLDEGALWASMGLVERILAETAAVFFVPVLLLGTISPQVIRLAVIDVRRSGRVAGEVYAWSTAGAIVGTFATGWWLVSAVGVHTLVFGLALLLLLLGMVVGRFWSRRVALATAIVVAGGAIALLVARDAARSRCTLETNYYCIKVGDAVQPGTGPVKTLVLDHLVHSYVKPGDPTYLGYVHEQIQADITRFLTDGQANPRVLVIGGGGYTYPRWVASQLPRVGVEVVEIDPGVTQVAHRYLDLPDDTPVVTYNLDGRQFVQEQAPKGGYTLVVQDAVNDLSVPYHIMTKEYDDRVRELLQPGGAYLLTVIDLYRDGQLLRSALRTMRQAFPRVQLLAAGPAWQSGGANVWVIAGSENGIDVKKLGGITAELPQDQLDAYVADGPQIVLTDQYAPVDNLIATLFRSRG